MGGAESQVRWSGVRPLAIAVAFELSTLEARGLTPSVPRARCIQRCEWRGRFERAAGAQHQRIRTDSSDDLQADRQARFGQAAGNRCRWLRREVEGIAEGRPVA